MINCNYINEFKNLLIELIGKVLKYKFQKLIFKIVLWPFIIFNSALLSDETTIIEKDKDNYITINHIFNKFNLRTIHSALGQELKYNCKTFLSDFYTKDEIILSKNKIKIEDKDFYSSYELNKNILTIVEKALDGGNYYTIVEYKLERNNTDDTLIAVKEISSITYNPYEESIINKSTKIFINYPGECLK